jgi:hypothetical protein
VEYSSPPSIFVFSQAIVPSPSKMAALSNAIPY